MIDKEKILEEIERLQKPTTDANHNFTSDYNQGFYDGLSQLELFIDTLPEEKKPIREYVSPEDSTLGKLLKEMKDFSPQEDLGLSNEEYNFWKDAQGNDLPEIDREVIVLYQPYPCEGNEYAVSFAHRPPERWYGRDWDGEEHVFEPKTYDKGEWNIPNVVWWLDLDLPIK